jgi:NADH-quinone oxidoreductase subunit H
MESTFLIYKLILILVIFVITMLVALYSTYAERKVAAFMQDRLGPNRAGLWGLLQPLADGIKMFTKEEIQPNTSDRLLFLLGPSIAMLTALMTSAVIPWGRDLVISGQSFSLMVGNINIAILYIFGVVSMGVYGILIGGWASNNKYSLLGAVRASSQMISYELAMGLSLVALIMWTGSMNIKDIVEAQQGFNWNIWYQPVGFLIFIICAFAECNRAPFDLPECETELVGGYHTEYSSMKLGLYLFAEYINMFISSCIIASLYFGGYNFPFIDKLGLSPNALSILGSVIFFLKIIFFIFFFMWVRWTLPRFRFDQLLRLGWRILIPVAIINILVTGGIIVLFK